MSRADGGWWLGGVPPYGDDLAYYSSAGEYLCTVRFMGDGTKQVLNIDELTRIVQKGESVQFTKKDKSRLVLSCEDRKKLIAKIFDWYMLEGIGYKSIAERLNKAGVPTPMGGRRRTSKVARRCATTIMSILKNPAYTGDMVWNRLSFAKFYKISDGCAVRARRFPGHGALRNGQEDWIVHRNSHPSIITRTRFDQAQKRREATAKYGYANTHNVGRGARSPYLLTGLIHCTHCGHKWIGYTVNKGRKRKDGSNVKTRYYACSGYVNKGKSVCHRRVVGKEWLEDWVESKIEKILKEHFGTPEGLNKMRQKIESEMTGSIPQIGEEVDQVVARTKEVKQTISNLIENLTSTNGEYVDARLIELKRELAVLESKQLELKDVSEKKVEIGRLIDQTIELAGEFKKVYAVGTIEEKRLFLRAFLKRIELDPGKGAGRAMFVVMLGMEKVNGNTPLSYHSKKLILPN